jgi:hypothetical protein
MQTQSAKIPDPYIGVVSGFVHMLESKKIRPELERKLIAEGARYAKANKLSFTPTLKGLVKLAEHAESLHRQHMEALKKKRGDGRVHLTGYDRSTGVELS